jgi:DNA-directed RNA polymerase subunit delta
MIRKIVDYQKLNEDILNLLVDKFPDGYDDDDIISFRNANNELIEAVEVRTDDTIYLVKIDVKLVKAMEEHEDEDADLQDDDSTNDTVDIHALNEEDLD